MNSRKNLHGELTELVRQRDAAGGKTYWKSLDQLAGTEAFQELVRREFPALADIWPESFSRRKFLTLMGASFALAGLGGCSVKPAPTGTIVPYVHPPEEIVPGVPLFFATTMMHDGDAVGLLVESHEGRPTKIEGNPDHPASLGATNIFHQASVLTLYDPARSQTVMHQNEIRGWDDADAAIQDAMSRQASRAGAGLRLLTETVYSPTLGQQIDRLLQKYPQAKWHQFEPVNNDSALMASQLAFGRHVNPVYDFRRADVVLSLDGDFLAAGPGHLRYANEFMSRRRVRSTDRDAQSASMNRLYVIETCVSSTGAKADHRLAVPMTEVETAVRAIAAELGVITEANAANGHSAWTSAVARDLQAHAGRCLVLAGPRQPESVHLWTHVINQQLGNVGQTVSYVPPGEMHPINQLASIRDLVDDMQRGAVEALFILGGNPVYTAPADLNFAANLEKVPLRFHLSLYEDETSRRCQWHLPQAHYLEAWSDARAFDGTASIVQPLIEPLYQGRSAHEVVAELAGEEDRDGRRMVRSYWRNNRSNAGGSQQEDFEEFWQLSLHDGVIRDTAFSAVAVKLQDGWQSRLAAAPSALPNGDVEAWELSFQPDPTIYDGRYANNGWLQELPKPVSKLTWDNAAIVSPASAVRLGVELGAYAHGGEHGGYDVPMVTLQAGQREVQAPIWIMPGHADGVITVYLGHGRKSAARHGGAWHETLGFDAYALRTTDRFWLSRNLQIRKADGTYPLACTQGHHSMDGRDVIRAATLAEYQQDPRLVVEEHEAHAENVRRIGPPATQYPPSEYAPPLRKWGMLIDLTTCTGCNACVVACQAENNIPVVGKEQVRFGREMHWLRVDRYIHGEPEAPDEFYFQPIPCMHCEHAPCEYVCPVEATVHSAEGLNDMIYNRCVGTRFCSNNCPYKVRRFNFLHYSDFDTPSRRLQYNPDVTVRSRGVMEKCSYCVQRIRQAEINAEAAGRPIRDGEVLTACQAACPTQAIAFGDLNDDQSTVTQWKDSPLEYGLLAELNTFPRTTYLAALRNPNPELERQQHGE